jgi:hypothetical protein
MSFERKKVDPDRGKKLWAKTRNVFRAVIIWKRVRSDLVLYGTHNYEFRTSQNIVH